MESQPRAELKDQDDNRPPDEDVVDPTDRQKAEPGSKSVQTKPLVGGMGPIVAPLADLSFSGTTPWDPRRPPVRSPTMKIHAEGRKPVSSIKAQPKVMTAFTSMGRGASTDRLSGFDASIDLRLLCAEYSRKS